jgi:hypothetical protein
MNVMNHPIALFLIGLSLTLLGGCGKNATYFIHTDYNSEAAQLTPSVKLRVGETRAVMLSGWGFGANRHNIISEHRIESKNDAVVETESRPTGRETAWFITGREPGTTRVYYPANRYQQIEGEDKGQWIKTDSPWFEVECVREDRFPPLAWLSNMNQESVVMANNLNQFVSESLRVGVIMGIIVPTIVADELVRTALSPVEAIFSTP